MSRPLLTINTWAATLAAAAFLAVPTARSAPVDECTAYSGYATTDSTQQCLVDGSATLIAFPGGDAVIPPGYQLGYVLTSTNGLTIEQVGPDPVFIVSTVNVWRIHALVYDPATLDFNAILDLDDLYQLYHMLIQGGGSICASLNTGGAGTKTTICGEPCSAEAGTISALNPDQCLTDGEAQLEATPDGNAVVPDGFSVIHVLTTGPDLLILATGAEPSFTVNFEGPFTIHTLVYDPATLDLSGVVPGETSAFEIFALLQQGGGPVCGAIDMGGAEFQVADCNPVCDAFAGTLTAVESEVCLVDGIADLDATPNGDAVVPDGYSIAYILARANGIIENVEPITLFEWPLIGEYVIHTLVYDPFTIDPFEVTLGVTTIEEINSVLIQGGGPVCGSLDLIGAPITVIACEPTCDAAAGTLTAVDSEVCRVDGNAHLESTPNGDALVPAGYGVAYILARANGIIENVEPDSDFEWPLLGEYVIHTLVYDPATLNPFTVVLGVTNISFINSQLLQGGGSICGSLDLVGAAFTVIDCAPPCDEYAGVGGDRLLCFTDPVTDLFALLTNSPDEGGSWSGPDGQAFSGSFNPATDAQGVYVYFVTDGPDCPGDTAQLVISLIECPGPCDANAGPDATYSVCNAGAQPDVGLDFFLNGDSGGFWIGPDGQPSDGNFALDMDPPGAYAYVVGASEECDGDTAYVTVIVVEVPDAGTSSEVSVCDSDAPFSCLALLGGTPDAGGSWTGPDGAPFSGTFDPATDVPGVYLYTVPGQAPCLNATATLAIVVTSCCDAGADSDTTVCFTDTPFSMFAALDGTPCPGGTWTDPPNQPHADTFIPGVDAPGVYIYTVVNNDGSIDQSTLTIDVIECPNNCEADAGTLANDDPEVCLQNGTAILASTSNGDASIPPGYISAFLLSSGAELTLLAVENSPFFVVDAPGLYTIHTLVYDPNTLDLSAVEFGTTTGGEVNALLIQGGGNICASLDLAGAQFFVSECTDPCAGSTPDAGIGGDIIRCTIDPEVWLFDLLQGTPDVGGTWTGPNGDLSTGFFDPLSDQPGVYVYTVFDLPDCEPDTTQLNIMVVDCPQAQQQLAAWPNPSTTQVSVRFPAQLSGGASIDIIDALGRSVRPMIRVNGDLVILDVSGMPAGTYTLRAIDGRAAYTGRFTRSSE